MPGWSVAQPERPGPPALALLARDWLTAFHPRRLLTPRFPVPGVGQDRPVLVLPGFLASDLSTRALRLGLGQAGFRVNGWGHGLNLGLGPDILDRVDRRLSAIAPNRPVALVGWSLGGLVAREYAKVRPERVSRVVTLGAPVKGDPHASNHLWRLYELVAGHKVDAPPIPCTIESRPLVETIALWSRRDGVVSADSARAEGCVHRSVELGCGHIEMTFRPEAIRAVVAALQYGP